MKQITVLTTTLNSEKYIKKLILSLEKQSSQNFQWLIVDGGSKDKTLKEIKKTKINFKIINNKNDKGIYNAMNIGIKNIQTPYYIVMGSDDVLYENTIKKIENIVVNKNADIFFLKYEVNKKIISYKINKLINIFFMKIHFCHSVALVINKSLHEKIGPYNESYKICSDKDFIIKCHKGKIKFDYINHISGNYNNSGLSNTMIKANLDETKIIFINNYNHIPKIYFILITIIKKIKNLAW
tara:strand:- start:385 stop:1104 length:720 start_codon:yes stop_codon:yes gene_type:complete